MCGVIHSEHVSHESVRIIEFSFCSAWTRDNPARDISIVVKGGIFIAVVFRVLACVRSSYRSSPASRKEAIKLGHFLRLIDTLKSRGQKRIDRAAANTDPHASLNVGLNCQFPPRRQSFALSSTATTNLSKTPRPFFSLNKSDRARAFSRGPRRKFIFRYLIATLRGLVIPIPISYTKNLVVCFHRLRCTPSSTYVKVM